MLPTRRHTCPPAQDKLDAETTKLKAALRETKANDKELKALTKLRKDLGRLLATAVVAMEELGRPAPAAAAEAQRGVEEKDRESLTKAEPWQRRYRDAEASFLAHLKKEAADKTKLAAALAELEADSGTARSLARSLARLLARSLARSLARYSLVLCFDCVSFFYLLTTSPPLFLPLTASQLLTLRLDLFLSCLQAWRCSARRRSRRR